MKKTLLLFLLCFVLPPVIAAQTITLVADPWPPYNNAKNDLHEGYIVDIARAVFEKHGYQVQYLQLPWKVAIEETRKGTYDGLIGADKKDGAGMVFPVEELGSYQLAFWVRKGDPWRFEGVESLQQVRLGVAEGYGYSPWLHSYIEKNKKDYNRVQTASGEQPLMTNLRKLLSSRIDVVTASIATTIYYAKKMEMADQIELAGTGGLGSPVYLVFSPRNPAAQRYARLLDSGIRELRKTGELKSILDKYGLEDWK